MIEMKELKEVVADVLDMDENDLHDEIRMEDLPEWDSVNAVRLMVHLESALGVRLPVEQVMKAQSLKDMLHAVTEEVV
ncbi:acyl carrier protein [Paenibacillus aceris]|uniref:Acyl carrier protein n=1 Tax=Paenibacillus aceris TaxID=869555 RepID=A0ABS4I657_9BACL|nr:acyl carrier protein [Paenibacillus aceris]MBP1965604.1 acyl carrier protein [Paenibacillus aceris]NHW36325.1 acyl carrier protein [Paenibacillus aceris]